MEQAPGWRLGDRRARETLTYGLPGHPGQGTPVGTKERAELLARMAECALELGQADEARRLGRRALEEDADNERASRWAEDR